MREQTRRQLERLIWRKRLEKIGIVVLALIAIGAAMAVESLDLQVENLRVEGTVEALEPLVSKTAAADGITVDVRLDDGRHVKVISAKSRDPHPGERIEVTEHRHGTGRVTHTLR